MSIKAKETAGKIDKILKKKYRGSKISLNFSNALELLVATILSAQCTDERVNKVTPALFKKYRKAKDFANAPDGELEEYIRSTGFYNNKAKSIRNCCKDIVGKYGGKVPSTMEELVTLAGVGRKTANVILGNVYDIPGIVVDTHVGRISLRLEFTTQKNPDKVEQDLMELIPKKEWTGFSHRVILFGREVCGAKKPKCDACPIFDLCSWKDKKKAV